MKRVFAVTAALVLLGLGIVAQADVFNLGTGFTNLETVQVGDPGNAGELSGLGAGGYGPDRICGSVGYNYRIGTYEVTAKQYTDFLNAKAQSDPYGLYNTSMWTDSWGCKIQQNGVAGSYTYNVASDYANRPVNHVSYWDSVRFANWLGNGQGNGDTETGAYTLSSYNGTHGGGIQRNPGWKWAVTSEDEWYKAAYYDPNKSDGAGYWLYPTSNNTIPGRDMADVSGNNANYYGIPYPIDSGLYYTTVAGEFQNSDSPYGTFDQGGNVWEWNEGILGQDEEFVSRGVRGGAFGDCDSSLKGSPRGGYYPTDENITLGFRVVQSVPEPSSLIALGGGLISLLGMRRRRA